MLHCFTILPPRRPPVLLLLYHSASPFFENHCPIVTSFIRRSVPSFFFSFAAFLLCHHAFAAASPFFRLSAPSSTVTSSFFLSVAMHDKLFAICAEETIFYCLNKLSYNCIVARSHNDNVMVTYRAWRAWRALLLYTSDLHWLKLCVRQCNVSV